MRLTDEKTVEFCKIECAAMMKGISENMNGSVSFSMVTFGCFLDLFYSQNKLIGLSVFYLCVFWLEKTISTFLLFPHLVFYVRVYASSHHPMPNWRSDSRTVSTFQLKHCVNTHTPENSHNSCLLNPWKSSVRSISNMWKAINKTINISVN